MPNFYQMLLVKYHLNILILLLQKDTNQLLIDAGCKTREMHSIPGPDGDRWMSVFNGNGKLLANGACIDDSYTKNVVPEKGITKIYSVITNQTVRSVDSKEGSLSIDFTIKMTWEDPHIKTKYTEKDIANEGIALSNRAIGKIWTPDLRILNRKSFKIKDYWASIKTTHILTVPRQTITDGGTRNEVLTTIELTYEIESTIYCEFQHSAYPLDNQACHVSMGSSSHGAIFVLDNREHTSKRIFIHSTSNFNISTTLFDQNTGLGNNLIGINIQMNRKLASFMLQYYIPCIAIVLVSQVSFVIPVHAIPGRVALLVTLFLTMVNLFIHQMVSMVDTHDFNCL